MKIAAFKDKDYTFTADLYTFTTTTDEAGGAVYNYNLARSIAFTAVTGMFGTMKCYFKDSESDIVVNCRLENLRDASGQEIAQDYIWVVDQYLPNINIWGHREGFTGRIKFFGTPG